MPVSHSVRPLTSEAATDRPRTARRAWSGRAGRRALAPLVLSLAAFGCNKPSAKSCEEYNTKMCEVVGPESAMCKSIQETTALMGPAACAAGLSEIGNAKTRFADQRKPCNQLVEKLCKDLGPETETCDMVKSQSPNIPIEQCNKMNEQYAGVLTELKQREARNAPLAPEKVAELTKGNPPSFGPDNAKVTVVEFSDFQCPFCSKAATSVKQLKEKYGSQVRFVFRQFPLSFHDKAQLAAEASLAAHAQGKFWQFHDRLFADPSKLDRESLVASAKELGLDMDAFTKALDAKAHASEVDADIKLGESANVNGTPTMFVNGKRIADPSNFDALSKQIDAALAKSS